MYEDQTYDAILKRMLDRVPSDVDKRQGSIIYDALAPAAAELAEAYKELDTNINLFFATTSSGEFLERRTADYGVTRKPATKARRKGMFYDGGGDPFDVPIGSRFSVGGLNFVTLERLAPGEFILECEAAGSSGNSVLGSMMPIDYVNGLARAELTDVLVAGEDEETDAALRARYLLRVRSPSSSGNKADYVNWALEVPGVGGVSVVPVRDGPGTVSVAIIDTNKAPASQSLIDAVQNYIAPPWENTTEAESMTLGGSGTSIDGDAVKVVYDAAGPGTLYHSGLQTILQQPGIWQARISVKVDANTGTNDLLQIGIWNVLGNTWAKVSPSSSIDAVQTLQGTDLSTSFDDMIQAFYWNGTDQVELRITRLQADTSRIVWVDRVTYQSTFSKDIGDGKAPVGAKVTVEPAGLVLINVTASLTIASGYNAASVRSAVQQNIADYIRSLAFTDDNDVRYVRIGQAILDTVGVQDYQNLQVNGGTVNIVIGVQEVAVVGTVTLT